MCSSFYNEELLQEMTTSVDFKSGNTDSLTHVFDSTITVTTQLLSKPQCEVADVENHLDTVKLVAYQQDGDGSGISCDQNPLNPTSTFTALHEVDIGEKICYRLEAEMGGSDLVIDSKELSFYNLDGSPADVDDTTLRQTIIDARDWFPHIDTSTGSSTTLTGSVKLHASLQTNATHAGLTAVLVVDFHQELDSSDSSAGTGQRRRLRQQFVLGASPGHEQSTVRILPAAVQVADELEAAVETAAAAETEAVPEVVTDAAEHEGLGAVVETSSGLVIGSIAGGIVVVLVAWFLFISCRHKSSVPYHAVPTQQGRFTSNIAF